MKLELLEIPGLAASDQTACKIRVLCIDGKALAMNALAEWELKQKADFRKIMKNLRILGQMGRRVCNEKRVQECANPKYAKTYEVRADKGHARLMFFYDDADDLIVVCTNDFWKGAGSQDMAFRACSELKSIYFNAKS